MRIIMKKYVAPALIFLFMAAVVVSLALAGQQGRGQRRGPIRSVAEPATIVLLGAGLVGLGAYAIKRRKKQ